MPHNNNLLLEALPQQERQAVKGLLKQTELKHHQVVFDVHDSVGEIYFPANAVISLVIPLSTGEVVETAMVGRDGVVAAAAALNGRVSLNRGVVQIGGDCLFCTVDALKALLQDHPAVRSLLGAHEQALFAQAQQSAAATRRTSSKADWHDGCCGRPICTAATSSRSRKSTSRKCWGCGAPASR